MENDADNTTFFGVHAENILRSPRINFAYCIYIRQSHSYERYDWLSLYKGHMTSRTRNLLKSIRRGVGESERTTTEPSENQATNYLAQKCLYISQIHARSTRSNHMYPLCCGYYLHKKDNGLIPKWMWKPYLLFNTSCIPP